MGLRALVFLATMCILWPVLHRQCRARDFGSTLVIAAVFASAEYAVTRLLTGGVPLQLIAIGLFAAQWAIAVAWTIALALLLRRALGSAPLTTLRR